MGGWVWEINNYLKYICNWGFFCVCVCFVMVMVREGKGGGGERTV